MNGFATSHTVSTPGFRLTAIKGALAQALAYLGKRDKRKVAHNTYMLRTEAGAVVRFHATDIVTITAKGVTLSSGGFRTYTTKERLNDSLPRGFALYARNGLWYLTANGETVPFADGITLAGAGKVTHKGSEDRDLKLRANIHLFARTYARKAWAGEIAKPGPGDCWLCCMHVQGGKDDGKPIGDVGGGGADHLREHLREGYYVPSLLCNAAKATGNRYLENFVFYILWGEMTDDERKARKERERRGEEEIRRTVRKYLGSKLGLALR